MPAAAPAAPLGLPLITPCAAGLAAGRPSRGSALAAVSMRSSTSSSAPDGLSPAPPIACAHPRRLGVTGGRYVQQAVVPRNRRSLYVTGGELDEQLGCARFAGGCRILRAARRAPAAVDIAGEQVSAGTWRAAPAVDAERSLLRAQGEVGARSNERLSFQEKIALRAAAPRSSLGPLPKSFLLDERACTGRDGRRSEGLRDHGRRPARTVRTTCATTSRAGWTTSGGRAR